MKSVTIAIKVLQLCEMIPLLSYIIIRCAILVLSSKVYHVICKEIVYLLFIIVNIHIGSNILMLRLDCGGTIIVKDNHYRQYG